MSSSIIKKQRFVYTALCLCGNTRKYDELITQIAIKEENEILREKYMDSLRVLKQLYNDGTMLLNKKTLEKVMLHLDSQKVLSAAGIDTNFIPIAVKEKMDWRGNRKYITKNVNKLILQK